MSDNPRHSSESNEHFTPSYIVEAARATLGSITLDPASCAEANQTVKAWTYLSQNGAVKALDVSWAGNVFVNPPGGRSDNLQRRVLPKCRETGACGLPIGHFHEGVESSQKKWWFKLASEWLAGDTYAAIFVCFSIELFQTTQNGAPDELPIPLDFPICFPASRVAYVKPGGKVGTAPPHASAIVFLPQNAAHEAKFVDHFSSIGRVILPRERFERRSVSR